MKFSVLMSLYYQENAIFLRECLASIQAQTLAPDEVVIVFDGEIPVALRNTVEVFKSNLPIKIVELPENVGLGKALNAGLMQCKHDWVFRMDTDDICVPERFAKQVTLVDENPDISICGGQIIEFTDKPTEADALSRTVPLSHEAILSGAKRRNPMNHMTVMYNKSAVVAARNYRHAPFFEDYDLWARMLVAGARFANLPDVLVYARTGTAMYQRRGGIAYAKSEMGLQRRFLQWGFIGISDFVLNVSCRIPVRLLPNRLRKWVYSVILRK